MTLEFKELVPQIAKMGSMLEQLDFDLGDRLEKAFERFEQATDLDRVWERIDWVRQSDVSGYRGAAPMDTPDAEPVNLIVPAPEPPPSATLIAVDGSQIYPNERQPLHYFLLNMGALVYHHGSERTPDALTSPRLFFHKDHVHDRHGRIIRNREVDDRRTIAEIHYLAEQSWHYRDEARPLVALFDNSLLVQTGGGDPRENAIFFRDYMAGLVRVRDALATLAGYVDDPSRSERFIRLLALLGLESPDQLSSDRRPAGDLEGLGDKIFFERVLAPGERSAIMVQNSPRNLEFKERNVNFEIAFFYLNVGSEFTPHVVRIDIPVWVARDQLAVEELHGLLLAQCRMQGRNPYPYALTRAHEQAVVSKDDQRKVEALIKAQVRVSTDIPIDSLYFSAKTNSKFLLNGEKRRFDTRSVNRNHPQSG